MLGSPFLHQVRLQPGSTSDFWANGSRAQHLSEDENTGEVAARDVTPTSMKTSEHLLAGRVGAMSQLVCVIMSYKYLIALKPCDVMSFGVVERRVL